MKRLLFSHIFLLLSIVAYSQCPDGDVSLETQEDIDNFIAQYPNCTEINGDLSIGDFGPVTSDYDLTGLSSLTEITGTLRINSTGFLDEELGLIPTSLAGLENITSVKNLIVGMVDDSGFPFSLPGSIESLNPLSNISGMVDTLFLGNFAVQEELPDFNQITDIIYFSQQRLGGVEETPAFLNLQSITDFTVGGHLNFYYPDEPNLKTVNIPNSLNALPGEVFIGPFGPGAGIFIYDNDSLEQVVGGENLIAMDGTIVIERNASLTDLSAFNNLETTIDMDLGLGYISISTCRPEVFDAFHNLNSCMGLELKDPETVDFCDPSEEINIGIGLLSEELTVRESVRLNFDHTDEINFLGNLKKTELLDIKSISASFITGFQSLDSLVSQSSTSNSPSMFLQVPQLENLPNFENLVYASGEIRIILVDNETFEPASSPLINLEGLNALETCGGLRIQGDPEAGSSLSSLQGLDNLDSINDSGLRLGNLNSLASLDALSSLEYAERIWLRGLPSLENPTSFQNINQLNRLNIQETGLSSTPSFPSLASIDFSITIDENPELLSISGLNTLEQLNGLSIDDNPQLSEVLFDEELSFTGILSLENNVLLDNCGMSPAICNIVSQANMATISNNGQNCSDSLSVAEICATLDIKELGNKDFKAYFSSPEELSIEHSFKGQYTVSLFNLLGQRVFTEKLDDPLHSKLAISRSLEPGFYMIRIQAESEEYTEVLPYFF